MSHLMSLWNRIENRVYGWASIIGLAIVVVGLLVPLPLAETTKERIYANGLVLVSLGGVVTFLAATLRSGRKACHAEAIVSIRESVHKITTEGMRNFRSIEDRKGVLSCAMDD